MSLRIIEISAPENAQDKIRDLGERYNAIDCWQAPRTSWLYKNKKGDPRTTSRLLVDVKDQQELLDALQRAISRNDDWRITLIPVEATLPRLEQPEKIDTPKKLKLRDILKGSITREELHDNMEKSANLSIDFMILVLLSSLVAGIGLIQSDVAVIIGAMVIAPLLGPNLALAFGAALGDKALIIKAAKTNCVGIGLTLMITIISSLFISNEAVLNSMEMMNRTNVGFASIILALASGAAGVLSLTMGASSALVGVMVAVALMPPAVTLGLTLGNGHFDLAYGTFLLLATNIVCVNLSAQAIFRLKGIRPRTWFEEKKAKQASKINTILWFVLLVILAALIWLKTEYSGS